MFVDDFKQSRDVRGGIKMEPQETSTFRVEVEEERPVKETK